MKIWQYDDPLKQQSLRWDPGDDIRYALGWRDPSGDPHCKKRGSMLGANRLAIEGLPMLSVMPVGQTLQTTGFHQRSGQGTIWCWPIWNRPATDDVVRSLLASPLLGPTLAGNAVDELQVMGVVEVYKSRRLTVGKFRNFTPGEPVTLVETEEMIA